MSSADARRQMGMRVDTNDAQLCVETFGDPADPPVLLIMGGGGSMDRWETPFCARLAAAGRHVIRYDHRDTGGSTSYPPGEPGYTLDDLVTDAVAVLDGLGIERAHLVGLSMGGALAQRIAVDHPERVLSVTLMSTSPAGSGAPELPPMSDELRAMYAGGGPAAPDWDDREAVVRYLIAVERPHAGRRGIDEPALRELLGGIYDRSISMPSGGNHFLVDGSDMPYARLREIAVPALVIHGGDDPLLPPGHGEALARAIPGASLLVIDGLGHELPAWAWEEVLPALIAVSG